MTTPKFTPGPWKTTRRTFNYGCYGHEISTTEGSQRVFVTPRRPEIATIRSDEDEDRANASLIASAPALYAALEAMVAAVKASNAHQSSLGDCIIAELHKAQDAIAQAKGESK